MALHARGVKVIEVVNPELGVDSRSRDGLVPRNRLEQGQSPFIGWQALLDRGLHFCDCLREEVDMRKDVVDQHQMVWLDSALECFAQLWQLCAEATLSEIG